MRMHHPWSSDNVDNEVDIMPVSRDQYNSRNTSVDKHFMKRKLVEKRKEEWKKMLKGEEEVPKSINYRANTKNKVKREVVAATAQRLSDNSHAAIREMRSARLSAIHTAVPKEPKSQSAREMRLARLKQNSSTASPPQIQHKSLKKGVRVEKKPEPKDQEQVTSSIREMRLAQGKAPVAKSYTSSTPVLRIPKTTTTTPSRSKSSPPVKSVRRKSTTPIRKSKPAKVEEVDDNDEPGNGCNFVNTDDLLSGGCNGFSSNSTDDNESGFVNSKDLQGGCNAGKSLNVEDVGCDMNMLKQLAQMLGCERSDDVPGADLVSRGSSEDSAEVYIKKYGYDF